MLHAIDNRDRERHLVFPIREGTGVDADALGAISLLNPTGQLWVWLEGDAPFVVPREKNGVIARISAHVHRESIRVTEKTQ